MAGWTAVAVAALGVAARDTPDEEDSMKKMLIAMAACAALTLPALAQAADGMMKCSAFNAMDSKGQMAAVDSLKMQGSMASDKMGADKMGSDNMASDKMGMVSDKMGSDKMGMASDKMESGKMDTGKMDSGMKTASGDSMMAGDDLTQKVSSYCQDHPDMMIKDAM